MPNEIADSDDELEGCEVLPVPAEGAQLSTIVGVDTMSSTAAPSTDSILFQQILVEQKEAAMNRLQGGQDHANIALPIQKPETSGSPRDENRYALTGHGRCPTAADSMI